MFGSTGFVARQVEHQVGDRQLVVVAVAGATAEGAHARQQLLEGEGLGQVVVGAGVQTAHAIRYGVARREHQDWRAQPLSPQLAGNLDAVHLGQHHVEHHQVMRAAFGAGQPLEAVVRHFNAVPDIGERPLDHARNARIILHHQNVHIVRCHHKYDVILCREPWNRLDSPVHAADRRRAEPSGEFFAMAAGMRGAEHTGEFFAMAAGARGAEHTGPLRG